MVDFKTAPLGHQREDVAAHGGDPFWARFWEPGVGKTWPTLYEAAQLEEAGEIRGMLILAPNGVHRNWVVDQIPTHMPDELLERTRIHTWQTSRKGTKWHREAAQRVLDHDGFSIVAMSYDAVMTEEGCDYWKAFLKGRPCLYALDESPKIKSPGTKRTKRILGSHTGAPFRRILTGTPVDDKPFDVYAQVKFLDPTAWHAVGCGTFSAFKAQFGVWKKREVVAGTDKNGQPIMREFPMLVEYRNLRTLREIVRQHGSRLLKEDVLDLPPKLYSKRYFEMTPPQRKAYEQLKKDMVTVLDTGDMVAAELVITRMLRLQQVTSGWLPNEDGDAMVAVCDPNPRVKLLLEELEDLPHQAIVWAKYRQDITLILEALRKAEISVVRYDGQCSDDQMAHAVDSFRAGDVQVFVANPKKGCEGITLTGAKTVIYYNNDFQLARRIQSEDRAHRIGQTSPVHIIDLAAVDSIDEKIIDILRSKQEMAAYIQGDEARAWL